MLNYVNSLYTHVSVLFIVCFLYTVTIQNASQPHKDCLGLTPVRNIVVYFSQILCGVTRLIIATLCSSLPLFLEYPIETVLS